jgi:FtsH-binding integral membrane protein
MIEAHTASRRHGSRTAFCLGPVLLVAAWGVAWIAVHASQQDSLHSLFQTLALAESVVALLLRRRKPVDALAGILAAYFVFELDPLLLPPLLIALVDVAALVKRRTALLASAVTAATVVALPLTGRASVDLAALVPRLLGVAAATTIGLWAQRHPPPQTRRSGPPSAPDATTTSSL